MNWTTARERAEERLRENPDDRDGGRAFAQATGALGDVAGAMTLMEAHLERHPDDEQAWDLLCAYRLEFGRFEEAVAASNEAMKADPSYKIAHYNRACAFAMMGNADNAIADLRIAIACDGDLRDFAREDSSFDALRELPEFQRLIEG